MTVCIEISRGGDIGGQGGRLPPPLLTGPNHRYDHIVCAV